MNAETIVSLMEALEFDNTKLTGDPEKGVVATFGAADAMIEVLEAVSLATSTDTSMARETVNQIIEWCEERCLAVFGETMESWSSHQPTN